MKNFLVIGGLLLSIPCALFGQRLAGPGYSPVPGTAANPPGAAVEIPRLTGIVDLPGCKKALFETRRPYSPEDVAMSAERESGNAWEVLRILPDRRSVEVRLAGVAEPLMLTLAGGGPATNEKPATIELSECGTYAFLTLFKEFTNRTLLISPMVPTTTFSLRGSATNSSEVAAVMERALGEKGIVLVPDGKHFVAVVPKEQVPSLKLHAPEPAPQPPQATLKDDGMMPPGSMDFRGADLVMVFDVYAMLINGRFDRNAPRPAPVRPFISLQTKGSCSKAEAIYALDTLFAWNGIKMVRDADGKVRAVSVNDK